MRTLQINHTGFTHEGKPLFEIMRLPDGKRCPPVALTPPSEVSVATHNTTLRQDLRWYLEDYLSLPIDVYRTRAENIQDTLKNWGLECFDALFTGHAQNWYYTAQQSGLKNLIIKVTSDDPAILAYPWEALYSDDDEYIAQQCRIERQLSNVADVRPFTTELPLNQLNILYIIARPYGEKDIDFQTLARPLVDFVADGNWPVKIDLLRPPTFDRLREVLRTNPNFYHVVHFDGHGGAPANAIEQFAGQAGTLVFEKENDPNNEGELITAEKLSALLREYNVPYMVLNACQSAMMDETGKDPFSSVAASLLKAGIRGVVAMSYSLWVSGAKAFVPAFYKRLFEEGDIAEAMRAGRQEMFRENMRDTFIGQIEFNDWVVPVLYRQTTDEQILPKLKKVKMEHEGGLPIEVLQLLRSDFIGRGGAIQQLERAMRNKQAGILIHGMAGEGKTTLAQGFLQWLDSTGGLYAGAIWFSFEGIRSASYVIDTLTDKLFGTQAMVLPIEQKLPAIIKVLKATPVVMIWDNFESVAGYGNVRGLLSEEDRNILKDLLKYLRGGVTKVIITSRSPEDWLSASECYRVRLAGLQGAELWQYCNFIVEDIGLTISRNDSEYELLINKLQGNPLAIRIILLKLEQHSPSLLLAKLNSSTNSGNNDASGIEHLMHVLDIFDIELDEEFAPILRLIGLHEQFVLANCVNMMLDKIGEYADKVDACFDMLTRAGLCRMAFLVNGYKIHPAVRINLAHRHPASEAEKRIFVDCMRWLCGQYQSKHLHEQRLVFEQFEINFRNALELARELDLKASELFLIQGLALYAQNARHYDEATRLYEFLAKLSIEYKAIDFEAAAYHQLGIVAGFCHNYDVAENRYKQSLAIRLEHGDESGASAIYFQLGISAYEQRNFDDAEKWYRQSLSISIKLNDLYRMAAAYHELGTVADKRLDFDIAEDWYRKSLEISLSQGDEHSASLTFHELGVVAENRKDFRSAVALYEKSLAINLKLGYEYDTADNYEALGIVALKCGIFNDAERLLKNALTIRLKYGDEHGVANTYMHLSELAYVHKDFNSATGFIMTALQIFRKHNNKYATENAEKRLLRIQAENVDNISSE